MPSIRAAWTWVLFSVTNITSSNVRAGSAFVTAAAKNSSAGLRTPTSPDSVTRAVTGSKNERIPNFSMMS